MHISGRIHLKLPLLSFILLKTKCPERDIVEFSAHQCITVQCRMMRGWGGWSSKVGLALPSFSRWLSPRFGDDFKQITSVQCAAHQPTIRGEELGKIRYVCGLNLLVRDPQWCYGQRWPAPSYLLATLIQLSKIFWKRGGNYHLPGSALSWHYFSLLQSSLYLSYVVVQLFLCQHPKWHWSEINLKRGKC